MIAIALNWAHIPLETSFRNPKKKKKKKKKKTGPLEDNQGPNQRIPQFLKGAPPPGESPFFFPLWRVNCPLGEIRGLNFFPGEICIPPPNSPQKTNPKKKKGKTRGGPQRKGKKHPNIFLVWPSPPPLFPLRGKTLLRAPPSF
eukprot:FR744334.1.p2 GENE.FR744334.1~~FR744334.1.p2  ORF type:complete len:143 (+),score=104.57 FR744334.1:744-1172(+)